MARLIGAGVVPAAVLNRRDGEVRPLGELRANQLLHQPRIDLDHRRLKFGDWMKNGRPAAILAQTIAD